MGQAMTRRDFVRASVGLSVGTAVAISDPSRGAAEAPRSEGEIKLEWRNRQPGMRYRQLGRTGFMVSEIVCGGDPIAPDNYRHVEVAIEMGLNYLDTSPAYGGGASERGYAAVIQGSKRDRVFVATKIDPFSPNRYQAYLEVFRALSASEQAEILREASDDVRERGATVPDYFNHYFTGQMRQIEEGALATAVEKRYGSKIDRQRVYTETIMRSIEGSLQRLGTDHVDLMLCPHGAASPAELEIPEIHEAFEKLRQQGKVRYLGVSAHNDPARVIQTALRTGVYSMAMVAYNIMNHRYVAPMIEEAHGRDFGVIAMKTGQAVFYPDRSTRPVPEKAALLDQSVAGDWNLHQKAYVWALSNPHLSAAISNMVDERQVRENLAVVRAAS
jgi:aryl-alcohol dehydrogenase-like predicted oxidoreductase